MMLLGLGLTVLITYFVIKTEDTKKIELVTEKVKVENNLKNRIINADSDELKRLGMR